MLTKNAPFHNTDLYKAISKLTDDEFKRTYDSLKWDPNQQIRDELGQDDGYCGDRDSVHYSQHSSMTKQKERERELVIAEPTLVAGSSSSSQKRIRSMINLAKAVQMV